MAWPFERANALGFAMFENFTSAHATLIDRNAAAAADGSIWSDIALVANLLPREVTNTTIYTIGQALIWEPVSRQWFNFGKTDAEVSYSTNSYGQGDWEQSSLASDTGANTTWQAARCAATNGNSQTVVGGYTFADSKKYRTFNGTTWAIIDSNAVAGEAITTLTWAPSANLFVGSYNTASASNLETSFLGTSWTTRTAPNAHLRLAAAASPARIVIIPNAVSNKFITSEDAITWTERTVTVTDSWKSITWNAERGLFMAVSDAAIVTSPDGITWTTRTITPPTESSTILHLRSIGRMWLILNDHDHLWISVDDGVNWRILARIDVGAGFRFEVGNNQIMIAFGDEAIRSFIGGV